MLLHGKGISLGAAVGVVGVTVNWVTSEKELMSPFELMAATSTVYSALGTKFCSVTLVLEVFTVV